ncbi:hypothetical protein [Roseateles violae]|uniref:Uncharacterized protein n=1 Tax=Roseateles violae TaxID=3058042 RepID=A0ABT8DU50_9BURK|nr:hypothetical protein [Pelomonas sp. PFR6]MDN3920550.1 hypothetical protein [Pelomonas sp. PFR6]
MKNLLAGMAIIAYGLTGCGGGGGDSGGASSTTSNAANQGNSLDIQAVGHYKAKNTAGKLPIFEDIIVAPSGKFAIYYEDAFSSSRGFVDGMVSGATGQFTGTMTDFAQTGVFAGSISGQYRQGVGLSGTAIYAVGSAPFDASFVEYMTASTGTTDAVGTWNGSDEVRRALVVTIDSSSSVKITLSASCQFTGTLKFSDGANTAQIATLTGSSSGTGCRFGDSGLTGLLTVTRPIAGGYVTLRGHAVRTDRKDGFYFTSTRCPSGKTVEVITSC